MTTRIYHNPRCSKSRATLELLRQRGEAPEIIEYLRAPPSAETLRTLIRKLGVAPRALVRTGEAELEDAGIELDTAGEEQIVDLLLAHPKLLQRPIVETEDAARIGRPPEQVLELFE